MISKLRETLAAFDHRLSWGEPFDWDEDDEPFAPEPDCAQVSTGSGPRGRPCGANVPDPDG